MLRNGVVLLWMRGLISKMKGMELAKDWKADETNGRAKRK